MRLLLVMLVLTAARLSAQSLNVDVGANVAHPAPTAAHTAAGFAGHWNAVAAPAAAAPLLGLDGTPSAVTLTSSGGFLNFAFDNPATLGEDGRLMDDCHDLGGTGSTASWSFANLVDGEYLVRTYAWAPDSATFRTRVAVASSPDSAQDVGGAWPGAQQAGTTYALHRVVVAGGTLTVDLSVAAGFGSLNGIQLVRAGSFSASCAGDGSATACPCGNAGGAGRGCANSLNPAGALLAASGAASVAGDTLTLAGSGMPDSSALYFQGTSALASGAGAAFGDGLRCAGGSVIRLGTKSNAAGASQYPAAGDAAVSVRGAVAPGDQRVYQVWYRNAAAFCQPETFNLTNAMMVAWGA